MPKARLVPKSKCLFKCRAWGILLASCELQRKVKNETERKEKHREHRDREKETKADRKMQCHRKRHTDTHGGQWHTRTNWTHRKHAHTDRNYLGPPDSSPGEAQLCFLSWGSTRHPPESILKFLLWPKGNLRRLLPLATKRCPGRQGPTLVKSGDPR